MVKQFKEEVYPAICKRAREEGAQIFWCDETGLNTQEYYLRGYSPVGVTPTLLIPPKREKTNMISAISQSGKCRFMRYDTNMTQQLFISFMSQMIRHSKHKIFIIVDNLKVHHGKLVTEWIERNKNKIEIFYTPSYAPEINPDEYLNHILKKYVHSGILPRTRKELKSKIFKFMHNLQRNEVSIKNIFDHNNLLYLKNVA